MKLPQLIVLGGTKCGTISLHAYLSQVASFSLPTNKETHYWTRQDVTRESLIEYTAWFRTPGAIAAEVCPAYLYSPEQVANRMARAYRLAEQPLPLLLTVVREPVARFISHYLHCVRLGLEERSLAEVIPSRQDLDGTLVEHSPQWRDNYYIEGLFGYFLQRWCAVWPIDRLFVINATTLKHEPARVVRSLAHLCGETVGAKNISLGNQQHNVAAVQRYRWLGRCLGQPPPLVHRVVKALLPMKVRRGLRFRLESLNTTPVAVPEYTAERARIRVLYEEDQNLLDSVSQVLRDPLEDALDGSTKA